MTLDRNDIETLVAFFKLLAEIEKDTNKVV